MNPRLLLRIAAGLLIFFAVGHTVGHLTRHNVTDPRARELQRLMIDNKFEMYGQMRSYDENYTGLSMDMIAALLAFGIILWEVAGHVDGNTELVRTILIAMTFAVSMFAISGFVYFFLVPGITCLLAALLMGAALAGLPGEKRTPDLLH
jgi:hypothetical protein